MKEIKVIPAMMPNINWRGVSMLCREVGLPDPTKTLDKNHIKPNDPYAAAMALQIPQLCIMGFLIFLPNTNTDTFFLFSEYLVKVKILHRHENDLLVIVTGSILDFVSSIPLACKEFSNSQDRIVFNQIYDVLMGTGIKTLLRHLQTRKLVDGSFVICS